MKNNAIYSIYRSIIHILYIYIYISRNGETELHFPGGLFLLVFVVVQVASATGNPLLGVLGDPTATATAVRVLASGHSVLDWAFYDAGLATGAVRPGGVTDVTTEKRDSREYHHGLHFLV